MKVALYKDEVYPVFGIIRNWNTNDLMEDEVVVEVPDEVLERYTEARGMWRDSQRELAKHYVAARAVLQGEGK